jgi:hypothetical protein
VEAVTGTDTSRVDRGSPKRNALRRIGATLLLGGGIAAVLYPSPIPYLDVALLVIGGLLFSPDAIELVLPGGSALKLTKGGAFGHPEQLKGQLQLAQQITVINGSTENAPLLDADAPPRVTGERESAPTGQHSRSDTGSDARTVLEQQFLLLCNELEPWAEAAIRAERSQGLSLEPTVLEAEAIERWRAIFNDEIRAVLAARDAVVRSPHGLTLTKTKHAFEVAEELQRLLCKGRREAGEGSYRLTAA